MKDELISRQAAIDAINTHFGFNIDEEYGSAVQEVINGLPSANLPIKEKCQICPHCNHCDVDDDGVILPSAVRNGHWIIDSIDELELSYGGMAYEPVYKCSYCGRVTESYVRFDKPIMPEDADFPNFCGWCGARMKGADDDIRSNR